MLCDVQSTARVAVASVASAIELQLRSIYATTLFIATIAEREPQWGHIAPLFPYLASRLMDQVGTAQHGMALRCRTQHSTAQHTIVQRKLQGAQNVGVACCSKAFGIDRVCW